jgi:hypothetical protein
LRRRYSILLGLKLLAKYYGKMYTDLIVPVRSNSDFHNSILEIKIYSHLFDLKKDFPNSFLELLDGTTSSYASKYFPSLKNNDFDSIFLAFTFPTKFHQDRLMLSQNAYLLNQPVNSVDFTPISVMLFAICHLPSAIVCICPPTSIKSSVKFQTRHQILFRKIEQPYRFHFIHHLLDVLWIAQVAHLHYAVQ